MEHLFEPLADTISEWGYAFYNHRITVDLDNRPGVRDDYMIHLEAKEIWHRIGVVQHGWSVLSRPPNGVQ